MKHFMSALLLWSGCPLALGAGSEVDLAKLKTVCSTGREAELLCYEERGGLPHAWFGDDWLGYDNSVFHVPEIFQKGLRLTCRCGEELNGKMLHNPSDTRFTTDAWACPW